MLERVSEEAMKLRANMDKIHAGGYSQAESDFWDVVQNFGDRTFYEYGFARWGSEYIRPKYKVIPTSSRPISMFHMCSNLKKLEKQYFDLSGVNVSQVLTANGNYNTFVRCSSIEEIEDIGLPAGGYYMTFNNCPALHTIEVIRVEASTPFQSAFTNCNALQNVTIEGTIGQNGFNVSWSPLTHDSLMSIINALETKTDDGSWTVTLGEENIAKLTEDELNVASTKGWLLA